MREQQNKEQNKDRNKTGIFWITVMCTACFLGGCTAQEPAMEIFVPEETTVEETALEDEPETVQPETIWVHVCGAVISPGVYELPAECRVYEAVQAAGGFTEEACEIYINQAQSVQDGMKLYIPTEEEVQSVQEKKSADVSMGMDTNMGETERLTDKVNLNTASSAQLCTLPGVGESRAKAILAYREEHGNFQSIEEIMKVQGIKEGMFAKMKDKLTIQSQTE